MHDDVHGERPFQSRKPDDLCLFHEYQTLIPDGYVNMPLQDLKRNVDRFLQQHAAT